jgi:hypothetical protein
LTELTNSLQDQISELQREKVKYFRPSAPLPLTLIVQAEVHEANQRFQNQIMLLEKDFADQVGSLSAQLDASQETLQEREQELSQLKSEQVPHSLSSFALWLTSAHRAN